MSDLLAPVERQTLATVVVDRLASHIQTGSFGPGDQLPSQQELSRQLGVSRPVLREALQGLATVGMLEIRQGSGIYVRDPAVLESKALASDDTHLSALQVLETRMIVEVEMAGLAAERATADDFHRMDEILARLKRAIARKRMTYQISSDFHRALARSCKNAILYRVALMLSTESEVQGVRVETGLPGISVTEYDSHLRLRNAVASGDPKHARAEMRRHLEIAHGWENQLLELRRSTTSGAGSGADV